MSKKASLRVVGASVVLGWLLIGLVPAGGPEMPDWLGFLTVGLVLGTIFGQVSLAAAWCAIGPGALVRRLPLSAAWLAAIVISLGSNSDGLAFFLVFGATVVLQWLVAQSPMWFLTIRYGLRVVHFFFQAEDGIRDHQFGIREVMV